MYSARGRGVGFRVKGLGGWRGLNRRNHAEPHGGLHGSAPWKLGFYVIVEGWYEGAYISE